MNVIRLRLQRVTGYAVFFFRHILSTVGRVSCWQVSPTGRKQLKLHPFLVRTAADVDSFQKVLRGSRTNHRERIVAMFNSFRLCAHARNALTEDGGDASARPNRNNARIMLILLTV